MIGCPMTTGIFAWVAASAAAEQASRGQTETTPYWRTLKAGGVINEKYPGGLLAQKKLLESAGHRVIQRGKQSVRVDLEKRPVEL